MEHPELMIMEDPRAEIEFWLRALEQENLSVNNIALLNRCLENELKQYIEPPCHISFNKERISKSVKELTDDGNE